MHHMSHLFTIFHTEYRKKQMGASIAYHLGERAHSFHYSLSSPLLSSHYFHLSFFNISLSVCVLLQVCMYFVCVCVWAVLSLSSEEVICSRGLDYNAHFKSSFRMLLQSGPKSAGEFGINLPFPSSSSCIMSFEFVYLIRPLGLLKPLV